MGPNHDYLPLKSQLISNPDPLELARIYQSEFGLKEIYLADLDSIMEEDSDNCELIDEIMSKLGAEILLDLGLRSRRQFEKIKDVYQSIIISTESMKSWDILHKALKNFGPERITVSIDTYHGQLLSSSPEISSISLHSFCTKLRDLGILKIILLELSLVGKSSGVIPENFLRIRENFLFNILLAGGFATETQILNAKEAGFNGVMVSTGLHLRSLTREKIHLLVTTTQNSKKI
jgi:uncharacterized protein related to proFAR isomerase